MRVLLVTHYFPPEIGAPQARLSELARHWAHAGHEVVVLTGMPNHPTGIVPPAYKGKVRLSEWTDGYGVERTWVYATPNEGVAKKTLGHLSFMVTSVVLAYKRVRRPEVVVVSSPTFFSIFSAWVLARANGARLVVEVRDLWPAIFVELGVLTNRFLIRALELLELWAYRTADAVVVVSEGFRDDLVRRGVSPEKVTTIRNGVDLSHFAPSGEADPKVRKRLGATEDETLVLYIGAHGISHALESVVDAAGLCEGQGIHVALVGEGAAKAKVAEHARKVGLSNLTMLPGVPRREVAPMLAAADICLVPLRDVPLFSTFIPSKMFEYLAAGRAVVGSMRGEAAEILRGAGGVVVEPEDPKALAQAIVTLAADGPRRAEMGRVGRAYVERNFDRRRLAEDYLAVLGSVTGGAGRKPGGWSLGWLLAKKMWARKLTRRSA